MMNQPQTYSPFFYDEEEEMRRHMQEIAMSQMAAGLPGQIPAHPPQQPQQMPGPAQQGPVAHGGALDPREHAALDAREQARRNYAAVLAQQAEEAEVKPFKENFLSRGVLPVLAGAAAMGAGAIPMALAFGLGATAYEGEKQKGKKQGLELEAAKAGYDMAGEGLAEASGLFGAGGANEPAQTRHFRFMTQGMTPEDKMRARRVELGLDGRAKQAGFSLATIEGEDGKKRPGLWTANGHFLLPDEQSPNGWIDLGPNGGGAGNVTVWDDERHRYVNPSPQPLYPPGLAPQATQQRQQPAGGPMPADQPTGQDPAPIAAPAPAPAPSMARSAPSGGRPNPLVSQAPGERQYETETAQRQAQRDVKVAPQGWEYTEDGRMRPEPGSEYDRKDKASKARAKDNIRRIAPKMMRDTTRALQEAHNAGPIAGTVATYDTEGEVGLTRRLVAVASPAYTLNQHLDSIKSNISIEELQKMREASPTGGALGQIPVQQQRYLMQLRGSLNPELDEDTLRENVAGVFNDYVGILAGATYGEDDELQGLLQDGALTQAEVDAAKIAREAFKQEMLVEAGWDQMGRQTGREVTMPPGLDSDPPVQMSPRVQEYLNRAGSR